MNVMRAFPNRNSRPRFRAVETLLTSVCASIPIIAVANATSAPSYVPAQSIPCAYGLPSDDRKSTARSYERLSELGAAVRVSIDAGGHVSDVVLEKSSGDPAFDKLALQGSRRAECKPFSGPDGKPVGVETNFIFNPRPALAGGTHGDQGAPTLTGKMAAAALPLAAPNAPLLGALPFEFGKPVDAALLARFGIAPGSSKDRLLEDWAKKLASDPDIKNYLAPSDNPTPSGAFVMSRALGILDGMARISRDDRERLMEMSTRALDNAPADCGGVKNLQSITTHYLSMGTESDEEFGAQLQAIFDMLKQATQSTPPPRISAGQKLLGQVALSASIADALKRDPAEAEDLGAYMGGGQAGLSAEAWCKAARVYRHALDATPQPSRDWVELAELENQRRSVAVLLGALTISQAPSQPGTAKKAFDYAELVRRRVRPNIVWNGKADRQETVVRVQCAPSGKLEAVEIVRSSGDPTWDQAAVDAVKRSDPMPVGENGRALPSFSITLRPGI